jgi:hypothetical protein
MIMTDTPGFAPALAGEPGFPDAAASGGGDGIDVLSLGRLRPASAAWLLIIAADGLAGETFTARVVPGPRPRAQGGDVVLRIAPGAGPQAASVSVSVWAVAAGTLVPVTDWDLPDDGTWAESVRPAAAFAMSALAAQEEHADLGSYDAVDLDVGAAVAGLPWPLPGSGLAVATG